MADMEQATVTSSSSQLETVQPFTIEESPSLEVGFESPKPVLDSNTLLCSNICRSPRIRGAVESPGRSRRHKHSHRGRSWTNSNQPQATTMEMEHPDTTSSQTSGSGARRLLGDCAATNQSARSTASDGSSSDNSKGNTNSNRGSDAMEESDDEGTSQTTTEMVDGAQDESGDETDDPGAESSTDGPIAESSTDDPVAESSTDGQIAESSTDDPIVETSTDDPVAESSTDAGATGLQSTDSETGEQQTDSVFANLADSAEAASADTDGRPAQPRQSLRVNKNEIANLIEKAILDFCSSRTVETMRRMFAGVTNDTETLQRDGGRHDDKSAMTPHPVTGELVKEGVIIGDVDVFAPRMQREYVLPVRDSLIEAFLKEPGVFRAICYRTRCQVEVTRRLLNRKLCIGGRWTKFMIIRIVGPTYKCIQNCDILLQKAVPSYKLRKEYHTPAVCRMFMREDMPDNADLYFASQRTGGTCHRYGSLKLESPYRHTALRSVGSCPWKFGLLKVGKLAFSGPAVRMCMKHVYPSLGYETSNNLEKEYQGVNAADRISTLYEQFHVRRQAALTLKRTLTIPVCR